MNPFSLLIVRAFFVGHGEDQRDADCKRSSAGGDFEISCFFSRHLGW